MVKKPINRRMFLKTAAGTGIAATAFSTSVSIAADTEKKSNEKKTEFAFFDIDCRHPDPGNLQFICAKTAEPISKVLNKIYAKADEIGSPILCLTCLAVRRHNPTMSVKDTVDEVRSHDQGKSQAAFVSLKTSSKEIERAILCKEIFLERKGYSTGSENIQEYATNVFKHNTNAVQLVNALGDRHWLIFGRGFRYCVVPTVVGLLALGKKVTVLDDAIMAAACNHTENDMTSDNFVRNVKYLKSLGAEFAGFDSVFATQAV